MTKAEHTKQLETRTYGIVVTNIACLRRDMQPESAHHPLDSHSPRDSLRAVFPGGAGGVGVGGGAGRRGG